MMQSKISDSHPLYVLFRNAVHEAMRAKMGTRYDQEDVERYLTRLLIGFMHTDQIFSIRNFLGERLICITDMVAEGDILLHADSFERERQVHKHIGDFLLFWSGLYPDFLKQIKLSFNQDIICDYSKQAKTSYYLASTFDYAPYQEESRIYRKLSCGFEDYTLCLNDLRNRLPLDSLKKE